MKSFIVASAIIVLCLSLTISVSSQAETADNDYRSEHQERVSTKQESPLPAFLEERASLLFRRLDTDYDKRIGVEDAQRGQHILAEQIPGISVTQFIEFITKADRDHDMRLSREELMQAIAEGADGDTLSPSVGMGSTDAPSQSPPVVDTPAPAPAPEPAPSPAPASLLEANAELTVERTHKKAKGFFGDVFNNAKAAIGGVVRRITGGIDDSQDGCVMCQYIVERIETNVRASGVLAGLSAPGPAGDAFGAYLEIETDVSPATALVEVDAQSEQAPAPAQAVGASIIGSTRQATRYQRQLERQKFNEIYRIADITLDDVCEQGMPTSYYSFCKSVYKVQSDVVDGLRYQYRPVDICYRTGMCPKSSYVTKGIHSRYRTDN